MGTRISGLASGMDVDTLVKDLMKAERMPVDKLFQKKKLIEFQRDDYREMNKHLKELDTFIFEGISRQSSFLKKTSTSSNEAVITGVANGQGGTQKVTFDSVSLATSRSWIGSEVTIPDTRESSKLSTLVHTLPEKVMLTLNKPSGEHTSLALLIDPEKESIASFMQKISQSELGVSAFYDESTKKVAMMSKETGQGFSLHTTDEKTEALFKKLGFSMTASELIGSVESKDGKDAAFSVNGLAMTRSSNVFSIGGLTVTLKNNTTTPVTVTTSNDTNSVFDTIVNFVERYNQTIDKVNKKIAEPRFRDFAPLTDEQRKGLSEKEAQQWDEKAKSGMLQRDSLLANGLATLRTNLYKTVQHSERDFQQLTSIGIQTTSNYLEKGKLVIDRDKLRQAIEKSPEAVMKLFTNNSTVDGEKGIAQVMRQTIATTIQQVEAKAGNVLRTNQQFVLGKQLNDMDSRMKAFTERLKEVESRYYKQFTAMEKAVQRSNQQSVYLSQQFSNGR
ncbi:flagellar capping protein [Fictibacillus macauensis ZFHKF-1]|uniref:Flagellar hook-associated protein 2 n=1 Tax=Fictibacillus macauensis ZFHKF-1 TaxID=1196324 RepID=I8UJA0_9BACL|nr:flagellar hook-associated protein 2 [Fictibacillus macauensis]EIT86945.1 flagellar capping protein [Fictibacillus macauensis ZFHKF-1]